METLEKVWNDTYAASIQGLRIKNNDETWVHKQALEDANLAVETFKKINFKGSK